MEDLYPQGQSCLQKEKKLLRPINTTRVTSSPPGTCTAVLQAVQELLPLLPGPVQGQEVE